ncbi:dienelactone hydrolase family protein, partial [Ralstonia pseudosolanacearum]
HIDHGASGDEPAPAEHGGQHRKIARHGTVTIGGDPAAREAAFTQLAAWLDNPHP